MARFGIGAAFSAFASRLNDCLHRAYGDGAPASRSFQPRHRADRRCVSWALRGGSGQRPCVSRPRASVCVAPHRFSRAALSGDCGRPSGDGHHRRIRVERSRRGNDRPHGGGQRPFRGGARLSGGRAGAPVCRRSVATSGSQSAGGDVRRRSRDRPGRHA